MAKASACVFQDHAPEFILLQEVGGTGALNSVKEGNSRDHVLSLPSDLRELVMDESSDLHDYRVFSGNNEAYLAQVIALDREVCERVVFHYKGLRFIAVCFKCATTQNYLLVVSAHFPHTGYPDEVYSDACQDLCSFVTKYSQYDTILGGDWNCQQGDPRFDLLAVPLSILGFGNILAGQATRFGKDSQRELDFFWWRAAPDSAPSEVLSTVISDTAQAINSDHAMVLAELFNSRNAPRKKRRSKNIRCMPYSVDKLKLRSLLDADDTQCGDLGLQQQWRRVRQLSDAVSSPLRSRKFKDSKSLKELCSRRRLEQDPQVRLLLTKLILSQRQAERQSWCNEILDLASQCHYDSIRQARRQHNQHISLDSALEKYSTEDAFVQDVHCHFQAKFGAEHGEDPCLPWQLELPEAAPFTECEVAAAVGRLKYYKAAGPSGISNEILKALAETSTGLTLLTSVFNLMLLHQPLQEQRLAELCLIAKTQHVSVPSDYRPIALMETFHKTYMKMLILRVQKGWQPATSQLGGLANCQLLDSLLLATNRLERESLQQSESFWLSADIQGAFDNVQWDVMHSSLLRMTDSQCHPELLRVFHEMRHHQLSMSWGGRTSRFKLNKGVLQGGAHSSQIFAMTMEALFVLLKERWCEEFPDAVSAWCYIDDCILLFRDLSTMERAVPWILQQFQRFGFIWNPTKTKICAAPAQRELFQRTRHNMHDFLKQCQVVSQFKYLGCMLTVPASISTEGPPLSDLLLEQAKAKAIAGIESIRSFLRRCHYVRWPLALRLLQVFVLSKWLWFSPCVHPTMQRLQAIKTFQLGILASALQLYVPLHCGDAQRRGLHRIRRRACAEMIRYWAPGHSWVRSWLWRRWSYLGHVLRMPVSHPTRMALFCDFKQVRDGRAITTGRWLLSVMRNILQNNALTLSQISNLYMDKVEWNHLFPKVEQMYALPDSDALPTCADDTWGRWAECYNAAVAWFRAVFCWREEGRLHFKWLDVQEGWMQLSFADDDFTSAVLSWLSWLRLLGKVPPFVVQLTVVTDTERWQECVQHLMRFYFDCVFVIESVPASHGGRVRRC